MDIIEIQRRSSRPNEYMRTNIKDHKIYVSIPKIGTEIIVNGTRARTDKQNRVVIMGSAGEIYLAHNDVISILRRYVTEDGGVFVDPRGGMTYNTQLINQHSKVINGIPTMDWVALKPRPEVKSANLWAFFVPKDACFDVTGYYSEEYSGYGNYIVCDDQFGAPNFQTRRVIPGKVFDTSYARTRAFDKIPNNFEVGYAIPAPKSWVNVKSTQGEIVTFKVYNERVFNTLGSLIPKGEQPVYESRGYSISDTDDSKDRLVTNLFLIKNYRVAGESYLTKGNKSLIYHLQYRGEKKVDDKGTFNFSPSGFGEAQKFVASFINKLNELKEIKSSIDEYQKTLKTVFVAWVNRLKAMDKKKVVLFEGSANYIESNNSSTICSEVFSCNCDCNNEYVQGSISGGVIALEYDGTNYSYVIKLIVGDEEVEFRESCTNKGVRNLTEMYAKTVLK